MCVSRISFHTHPLSQAEVSLEILLITEDMSFLWLIQQVLKHLKRLSENRIKISLFFYFLRIMMMVIIIIIIIILN